MIYQAEFGYLEWIPILECICGATQLIIDGHSSHITAPFIHFFMDHNILVLLLPLHLSHLIQLLDIGIFSPLKQRISEELKKILYYSYSNTKKFEQVDCYHIIRPHRIKPFNIQSIWSRAGLFPFNSQKVIQYIKAIVIN